MHENRHVSLALVVSEAQELEPAKGEEATGCVWFAAVGILALRRLCPDDDCVGGPGQEWFPLQCVDCVTGSGLN